jgi:hypothetical protein
VRSKKIRVLARLKADPRLSDQLRRLPIFILRCLNASYKPFARPIATQRFDLLATAHADTVVFGGQPTILLSTETMIFGARSSPRISRAAIATPRSCSHAFELHSRTKMFCPNNAPSYGADPNHPLRSAARMRVGKRETDTS